MKRPKTSESKYWENDRFRHLLFVEDLEDYTTALEDRVKKLSISNVGSKSSLEGLQEPKEEKLPETYRDLPEDIREVGMEARVECHPTIAKPMSAISALYDLRQEYWRIAGNWKPNWGDILETKFIIRFTNKPIIDAAYLRQSFLVFPSMKQAEHFATFHENLIRQAQPLL